MTESDDRRSDFADPHPLPESTPPRDPFEVTAREFHLAIPGVPRLWGKPDAGGGYLVGNADRREHTHFYFKVPGRESVGVGAHLKNEETGTHLYRTQLKNWLLNDDFLRWRDWIRGNGYGILTKTIDLFVQNATIQGLEEIQSAQTEDGKPVWRPLYLRSLFEQFEREPGVLVFTPDGMERASQELPKLPPEMFVAKDLTTKKKSTDVAFFIPMKASRILRLIRRICNPRRQFFRRQLAGEKPRELVRAMIRLTRWAAKAFAKAPDGKLYLACRADFANQAFPEAIDWVLQGAEESFESKDAKDFWKNLRIALKPGSGELDWVGLLGVDWGKLFGTWFPKEQPSGEPTNGKTV